MSIRKLLIGLSVGAFVGGVSFYAVVSAKRSFDPSRELDAALAGPIGIVVEPAGIDFGEQDWGQKLRGGFALYNQRDEALTINSIESNCGCTVLDDYSGFVVEAGGVLPVSFTLDTQLSRGPKTRVVTVSLASGEKVTVTVEVDVKGTYDVAPAFLEFGDVHLAREEERALVVVLTSSRGRTVREVKTNCRWAEVRVATRSGRYEILVRLLRENLAPGWSTGQLLIVTDDDKVPTVSVPISVKGVQDLTPTPSHVFLTGRQKKRAIFVTGSRKKASLVSASCSHPGITASVHGAELELHNSTGRPLEDTVTVFVTDAAGHVGRVLVSTF